MNSITIKQSWVETRVWKFSREEFLALFDLEDDLAPLSAEQRDAIWTLLTAKTTKPLSIPTGHNFVNAKEFAEDTGAERLLDAIRKLVPKQKKR